MSELPNTGGSAFPQLRYADGIIKREHEGMTLRDYFAAAALPAVLRDYDQWAETAYRVADAMLAERAKPRP